jgi:hypothetical protein
MTSQWKIIAGAGVILFVFLTGFVPQFMGRRRLNAELEDTRTRLSTAQLQIEIDELRSLAGRMLLEASHQNYGTAATHSTEYFNKVGELAGVTENVPLKTALSTLLARRDSINSGLAQGQPAIVPELQSLLQQTYDLPSAENIAGQEGN